jgi:hypothetical protein
VKGWSLSGVMHYQSGSPLTATDSVNVGLSGLSVSRRAQIVPGQSLGFSGTCSNSKALCWFNANAFVAESTLAAGDAPVNDLIGPSYYGWDLSARVRGGFFSWARNSFSEALGSRAGLRL